MDKNKNRTPYNPETDYNMGKHWSKDDMGYLCAFYKKVPKKELALALGRTYGTTMQMANKLKKQGKFQIYAELWLKGDL